MADVTISQYMELPIPVPTEQTGPEYAVNINQSLTQIDQHDHSTGKGTPVTPQGLNINTDLDFNDNNLTEVKSIKYEVQPDPLNGPTDVNSTYVAGDDLYYNDTTGTAIRLTQGGSIVASSGNITGLIPPAAVVYTPGTQTFQFLSSSAQAANLDAGAIKIREVIPNANYVQLSSPTSLPSNINITLPSALATSAATFWTGDQLGNTAFTYRLDNSSLATSGNFIRVAPRGVIQSALQLRTPATSAGPGGIAITQGSGDFGYSLTSYAQVPNQALNLITTGRPVSVLIQPATSGNGSFSFFQGSISSSFTIRLTKNSQNWKEWTLSDTILYPPGMFNAVDLPNAGSNSYTCEVKSNSGSSSGFVSNIQMIAYEI